MQSRPLGHTGLTVSILGFGASPLGGAFGPVAEAECVRAVRSALDLGVNFFDTSPFYGDTVSETMLGKGLKGIARERFVLATKVGRYADGEFDFSAKRVTESVDESLKRLQVEHLDVIQCHDIEFAPAAQIVDETLPALRRLRAAGKIRAIGITGLPLAVLRAVLERSEVDTALSYCHYCLNDTTLAGELPWLAAQGVGVINASPLAMGLLSADGAPAWHPAPAEIRMTCARALAHCRARGADLARLALQFALANSAVASTLVGIRSTEQLVRNVRWVGETIDPTLLAEVQAILAPIRDQTWPSGISAMSSHCATATSPPPGPPDLCTKAILP